MHDTNEVKMILAAEKGGGLSQETFHLYFVYEAFMGEKRFLPVKLQPSYVSNTSEYRHPYHLAESTHEVALVNSDDKSIYVDNDMKLKVVIMALSLQGVPEEAIYLSVGKVEDGCYVIPVLIAIPDERLASIISKIIEDDFELASQYSYWLTMRNTLVEIDVFEKHPRWGSLVGSMINEVERKISDALLLSQVQPTHCQDAETS